jgi:hypothetical protein
VVKEIQAYFEKSLDGSNVISWPNPHPLLDLLSGDFLILNLAQAASLYQTLALPNEANDMKDVAAKITHSSLNKSSDYEENRFAPFYKSGCSINMLLNF